MNKTRFSQPDKEIIEGEVKEEETFNLEITGPNNFNLKMKVTEFQRQRIIAFLLAQGLIEHEQN